MTASAYCTAAQLHEHGLPRGALPNPGRLVAAVYAATDTLELEEHGFASGAAVVLRAEAGGSMPGGLSAGTTYYVLPQTDATFKLSATVGGAAINLTSAGSLVIVSTALPKQAAIEWGAALIDDWLPAHVVPLTPPYPVTVVAANAELAIAKLAAIAGVSTPSLAEVMVRVQKQLERWGRGVPIRGAVVPASSNLAVVGSGASSAWGDAGVLP